MQRALLHRICEWGSCSLSVRFHVSLLFKLCLLFDVPPLGSFLLGFSKFPLYVRLFQSASLEEKLRNLGLSFPVHCSRGSVRKLRECDISLK